MASASSHSKCSRSGQDGALANTRGGWRAAPAPSLVPYGPRPAQDGHEAWADVVIVAHVLVLLLTPHQLHARVLFCLLLDQVERKRRDLGQGRKNEGHSQGKGGSAHRQAPQRAATTLLTGSSPGTLPRARGLAIGPCPPCRAAEGPRRTCSRRVMATSSSRPWLLRSFTRS